MQDFGGKSYPPAQPPTQEQKYWVLAAHLGPVLLGFIAPLIVWLVKKDESDYVAKNAMSALIFQAVIFISIIALGCITCFIGSIGVLIPMIAGLFYLIVGTVKSQEGLIYEYPFTSKFMK